MGNSHPQTNRGPSERAKTQSPQPLGQNSHRPAEGDEPAELNEVKQNKTESKGELTPEEQEIDRRLEAKAGLGLVVVLACAFGFMLWQKWSHRPQETYAQNETESTAQQNGLENSNTKQLPLDLDQPEPKPTPQADPFDQNPQIVQVSDKTVEHPLRELKPEKPPVTEKKPEPSHSENLEPEDPFGPGPSSKEVVDTSEPSKAGDPFGDEWAESPKPEQKPDDPPVLEFGDIVTDKDKPSSVSKEDPFGEPSEPMPVLRTEPLEGDPFSNPEPKLTVKAESREESPSESLEFPNGPTMTPQLKNSVASAEEEFSESLPVLERIPERTETASKNPFGDFEVVPAGSSRASSTTNVSTSEFPERKDPFETPKEQRRVLATELPRVSSGIETVRTYRIQENDTYWKISQAAYQTSRYYQALARYNRSRIGDPTKMPLGQEILLPPERELEVKYPDLFPGAQAADRTIVQTGVDGAGFLTDKLGTPQYRVGENDTLSAIAQRHLGRASRWVQIYELNRKQIPDPNQLKIGTVLTLPSDASNVRVIGERSDSTIR